MRNSVQNAPNRGPRVVVVLLLFVAIAGASADAQDGASSLPLVDEVNVEDGASTNGRATDPPPAVAPFAPSDAQSSVARPVEGSEPSYLCRPASLSAEALLREIDKRQKAIEAERAALDEKRRNLEAVVAELRAETERLESRMAEEEKKKLQETAAERAREDKAQKAQRLESETRLSKGIAKMDARSAAAVITSLEQDLAATVLKKLPPEKAGAALAAMEPAVAAALVERAALRTKKDAAQTTPPVASAIGGQP
jgi:flagellar motility protein MotE (MotC chaperone)